MRGAGDFECGGRHGGELGGYGEEAVKRLVGERGRYGCGDLGVYAVAPFQRKPSLRGKVVPKGSVALDHWVERIRTSSSLTSRLQLHTRFQSLALEL